MAGLNTNFGQIINIRLRPARAPNTFYDMETLMDTMLHELAHNVFSEHEKPFYGLFEEIKREWELLSSKGYQGEGFFSPGQRLGSGSGVNKSFIAATAADRRRIKEAAQRRAEGIIVGPVGRRLGGGDNGRRLGGGEIIEDIDPRQLAAMAAEQRARDQTRCGASQAGADMRRETERAQREGTSTQAQDFIDLNDLKNYDLEDVPELAGPPLTNDFSRSPPTSSIKNPFLSDWNCQQCTFQNPPLYLSCQICQTERKLRDGPGNYIDLREEFGISWDCQACTFKNENVTDEKCIICGTEI
jgi:DNA-dependent metalloprotease WSS1